MKPQRGEPIAIIGSGCRFPGGATTPSKLWELLDHPRDLSQPIPSDRFNLKAFYHPDGSHRGTTNVQNSYFLSQDIRQFDPQFFNIKPVEADAIDPQQRLLLETVYESLESAGLSIEGLRGSSTAVYVGVMNSDYGEILHRDPLSVPTYTATGAAVSILSNRISYFFDWHGPCMTIDTACSSSLVAMHQAVQALRSGESRMAIAAGANLILGPEPYIAESKLKMLSPTGRSRMWDQDADGYARGEAIAAVVLKPLSAALEDGDDIECIIRETGVNQDGRTKGITMPSHTAQERLIRETYERAGLDINNKNDRCQYFEAHGTGTPAGDPIEAEAVSRAFFGPECKGPDPDDILHVGSIKTVVGHTEGAAGLAGVLKVALALQKRVIPPNLHFKHLSPRVQPFYHNLRICTSSIPWPAVADGCPRRACVNSFELIGFGGTNSFAIMESYEPSQEIMETHLPAFTPFTFSAPSDRTLAANLAAYSTYLKKNSSVNLRDLAWTLQARRSIFPLRKAFSALDIASLCSKIDSELGRWNDETGSTLGVRTSTDTPRILGVFTGQGAQWASMGRELILGSDFVRKSIKHLEFSLSELPDGPSWSLENELLADVSSSRIGQAALSQPLCTAIQIVLVDLLHSAGIKFDAVVGHSSGEISAAYAAGFISASDAIRISYYRGVYAKLACGPEGKKGAMLAVGMGLDEAKMFCQSPQFQGRIVVAASNSAASVTLSGDSDGIVEAKAVLDEEKKFARLLKVDTGYHSHHMQPCSGPYVESLRACAIQPDQKANTACPWFSSVLAGKRIATRDNLKDVYWKDNMVNPVMFSQAIESAIAEAGPFDIALEVGPHPALKGPATQTIEAISEGKIPYSGLLKRKTNDIEAFSDALGFIWSHLHGPAINLEGFDKSISRSPQPKLLKGAPTYSWDHDRSFWTQSRLTRTIWTQKSPTHELLGSRCPDSTDKELRWRNMLCIRDIPWVKGHILQGQVIFPAAGYVVMALEAANSLAEGQEVKLVEVHDLTIGRPIAFDDDTTGVEIIVVVANISSKEASNQVSADFTCYSCPNTESATLTLTAHGRLGVTIGEQSPDVLPYRPPCPPCMTDVDVERFYSALADLGYGYEGNFRGLSMLKRKMDMATGLISNPPAESLKKPLLIHPATVDVAIHSVFAAFSAPNDGRLWSLHVPTDIQKITVNPLFCSPSRIHESQLPFDSVVTKADSTGLMGDVDVFAEDGKHAILQVEGMRVKPFSPASEADDYPIFSELLWDVSDPCSMAIEKIPPSATEREIAYICDRAAYFYLCSLDNLITQEERERTDWHFRRYLEFAAHIRSLVSSGKHPLVEKAWENDTREEITALMDRYPDCVDLRVMRATCENLPAAIRGHTTVLEHIASDLDEFYEKTVGFPQYNAYLGLMAGQIAHRYPHMNILEIGAGTGSATKNILEKLGPAFSSYTYTDISAGFFEKASDVFRDYGNKMSFKTLDIEKDVESQGFAKHSYDLVIASNVLHATAVLNDTMKNARSLLKPGGKLLLLEVTNNDLVRVGTIFGVFPGWWVGENDGRRLCPTLSPAQWVSLMRKTGFSSIDNVIPPPDDKASTCSVLAAEAVDDRVNFLRRPLSSPAMGLEPTELVILGGKTMETSRLVEDASRLLGWRYPRTLTIDALEDLTANDMSPMCTVLSLTELDEPTFKGMTKEKLESMKRLFDQARNVLWVTRGCRADEPYSNMMVGFGRSLRYEVPHLRLQFLDMPHTESPDTEKIAESLLRLQVSEQWEDNEDLLWSTEPELVLENGQIMIPRLYHKKDQILRYNSSRRLVTTEVSPQSSTIKIERSDSAYFLVKDASPRASPSQRRIQLTHSLLSSVMLASGLSLFVGLGKTADTSEMVLVLSTKAASIIDIPCNWLFPCNVPMGQEGQFLQSAAGALLVQYLATGISANNVLLVHEPQPYLAHALTKYAAGEGVNIICTTSKLEDLAKGSQWVFMHPSASDRAIRALLPKNVKVFVDFSTNKSIDSLGSRILACLPSTCKVKSSAKLFGKEPVLLSIHDHHIPDLVRKSNLLSISVAPIDDISMEVTAVPLRDIPNGTVENSPVSIVNWTVNPTVPVKITTASSMTSFASDKTYLLVGLTGELGRSLCQWMVARGARNVVLTSRSPKVDKRWLENLEATGATIKLIPMDVTNKQVVKAVVDEIRDTLPPIAGVANAAMVLEDTLFFNMSFETLMKVLKPKMDGSRYLDELFQEDTLDFFILFSSLACTLGNTGQSNYTAANMFMTGLVAQRRKRGLAATAINLGAIIGLGYISRAGRQAVSEQTSVFRYLPVSEYAFLQMFAEAVMASPANSNRNPELMAGMGTANVDDKEKAPWYYNPIFSHFILGAKSAELEKSDRKVVVPVKSQLLSASTTEQAYEILKSSFSTNLQSILRLPPDSVNEQMPLIEMGVDSLVAVEVRSWFLKELGIDMPVLKVLGGAAVADLCSYALEKLPHELIPNIHPAATETPATSKHEDTKAESRKDQTTKPTEPEMTNLRPSLPRVLTTDTVSSSASESPHSRSSKSSPELLVTPDTPYSISGLEYLKLPPPSPVLRREKISFAQSRFWFLKRYLQDQTLFNITLFIRMKGNLRVADLTHAVKLVGQRHEALRTCFFAEGDQIFQGVLQESTLYLEHKRITDTKEALDEFELARNHVFDLNHGKTMRVQLLSQSPSSHYIIFSYHHIALDGFSFQVFLSDLTKAYNHQSLSLLRCQFPEYSARQRKEFENGGMEKELEFWREKLRGVPSTIPLLPMSQVKSRQALSTYDFNRVDFRLNPGLAGHIKETSRKYKATSFHFYLAVLKALLFRFLDTDDLCIGIADANRNDSDVLGTVGLFLNLLPLRFRSKAETFVDAIGDARNQVYSALENSRLPFDVLLEELDIPRSATHTPLFQVFVDYRLGQQERQSFGECENLSEEWHVGKTGYDLSVDIVENAAGDSKITFRSQKYLYSSGDAEILMKSYISLLEAFSKDPSLQLETPEHFSPSDIEKAIMVGRGSALQTDWSPTLVHRIDDMINQHNTDIAVKDGIGNILTYQQMAERINAIAAALLAADITHGSRVVVFQEPTSDWICSLLAIMRVGAVYVPLDLRNPLPRLANIVRTCQANAILAHAATVKDAPELGSKPTIINLSTIQKFDTMPVPNRASPESPAAILHTSGSTGTPKGIVLRHSSLRNVIEGYTKEWKLGPETVLQQSAFSFDFSMDQFFVALATGGTVYIVPKAKRGDPIEMTKLIAAEGITYTKATPSEYSLWLQYGMSNLAQAFAWKKAFAGGERLTPTLKKQFKALGNTQLQLFNSYGPAEISVCSHKINIPYMSSQDDCQEAIPAGYPLPNYSVYIVDEKTRKPVPTGVLGEILIGGAGVGLGYLNNEQLTKKKFIPDVFAAAEYVSKGWNTMYCTGDRGKLLSDGALMFEGRIDGDTQVKIRGIRIELQDIESTILSTAKGVLVEAVVSVHGDPGQFLVAHVVFSPDHQQFNQDHFLNQLSSSLPLPQYMVPAMIIPLDKMPLNNHFKTDRPAINALPLPDTPAKTEDGAKLTGAELQLEQVWEKVISKDIINRYTFDANTDFFHVGGNSLLLVRLQALIRERFDVNLPLMDLFEASTLGGMSTKVQHAALGSAIDWKKETSISDVALPHTSFLEAQAHRPGVDKSKSVLLTGATGYLGKNILLQLVADNSVSKIHCVALRKAMLPVDSDGKIVIHQGDLTGPLLGLSEKEFGALASEVDVIIHSGANRSFWDSYQLLRQVNVMSTKALLKLALPRKIPIHFMSSGGVLDFNIARNVKNESEVSVIGLPPTDGSNGYVASKWASEKCLENAAKNLGLPVWIHRPLPVISKQNDLSEPVLQEFLHFSKVMKTVPASDGWRGHFDFIPVDEIANRVCTTATAQGTMSSSALVKFVLHKSTIRINNEDIGEYLGKHCTETEGFDSLPGPKWMGKAKKEGFGYLIAAQELIVNGPEGKEFVSRR
ncbi:MAG: putative Hybrid PKS-NRPS biosynthetic cluster [Cirrosporium novae-zelandiae]|nr:MAG: putative Hybrid PKS-NRPS biosynthetic cluster [Cirrosporium novae-zelandiae]